MRFGCAIKFVNQNDNHSVFASATTFGSRKRTKPFVYCNRNIYVIYTPNLGLGTAVSVREREQSHFRGSSEEARGSIEGARESSERARGAHWRCRGAVDAEPIVYTPSTI